MKYRIIAQVTDDAGNSTNVELMPETTSEAGWRCSHAIWPAWTKEEQTTECAWCGEPLVACEIVECPWCEGYVTTDDVLQHWDRGCYTDEGTVEEESAPHTRGEETSDRS